MTSNNPIGQATNQPAPPMQSSAVGTNTTTFKNSPLVGKGQIQQTGNLLSKIRAGIAAAALGNAVDSQPWNPPLSIDGGAGANTTQVRGNTTAYPITVVMTNAAGTHQFLVITAGITAAAEPAAVTTPLVTANPYNYGPITDGTAVLMWMGPVRTAAALAGAPLCYGGAKPAQLTTNFTFAGAGVGFGAPSSACHFTGGFNAQNNTSGSKVYTVSASTISASPNVNGNYLTGAGAVEFVTDAPLIAFDNSEQAASTGYAIGNGISIEIDDGFGYRRLFDGCCTSVVGLAAPNGFVMLDWRASGQRKHRKIRISAAVTNGNNNFYGRFYITPGDQVEFPYNPNRYRICIVGDSINANGSGYTLPLWTPPEIFGSMIGCDEVVNGSVSGTGFLANFSGAQLTYIQRIQDVVACNPDLVLIAGAYNDNSGSTTFTSAQRQAAMLLYLQTLRGFLPNAMIIMEGTWPGQGLLGQAAVEADQIAVVAQFGDANTFFMPVQTDNTPWITGSGRINALTGAGNADLFVWTDAIHPTMVWGMQQYTRRRVNAFKNLINTLSAQP